MTIEHATPNSISSTGKKTASGHEVFLGANNAEFTEKEIEDIKLDLDAGKTLNQQAMNKLIAAEERSTIERHFAQFENLNRETAEFLKKLGLSHLAENNLLAFRSKYQGDVGKIIKGEFKQIAA